VALELKVARAYGLEGAALPRTDVRLADALARLPGLTLRDVILDLLGDDELCDVAVRLGVRTSTGALLPRAIFGHLAGWRSFDAARQFARRLWLREVDEWRAFCRGERPEAGVLPLDVPSNPDDVYDAAWKGWADWLGPRALEASTALPPKKHQVSPWRTFTEARRFARSLGLRSGQEWDDFCAGRLFTTVGTRPSDVPASPHNVYEDEAWAGHVDWLGFEWLSWADARRFAWTLGLRSQDHWIDWSSDALVATHGSRPIDVPVSPQSVYPHAWRGWGDFLGTGFVHAKEFRPFEEARAFVRSLGLRDSDEWKEWARGGRPDLPGRPGDIPHSPGRAYRDAGWISMGDWLGTGFVALTRREFRPFEAARSFARELRLRTMKEWVAWSAGKLDTRPDLPPRPADIPACPYQIYEDEWVSFGDWLGTGRPHWLRGWRSFEDARAFARSLGLRFSTEWVAWRSGRRPDLPPRPKDVPSHPDMKYASAGWKGWADFLGREGDA
jgi:hypothetical protein